jgi:hypothetical protein
MTMTLDLQTELKTKKPILMSDDEEDGDDDLSEDLDDEDLLDDEDEVDDLDEEKE